MSVFPVGTDDLTVSVVIPTKNRPGDIARCLASLSQQTDPPEQIVVVDQSERRYDLPLLAGLSHVHDPSIGGAAAARNVGARLATSSILFFVDDDVELMPQTVRSVREVFRSSPGAIGIQCPDLAPWEYGRIGRLLTLVFEQGFFNRRPFRHGAAAYPRWLSGYAVAYRRRLFDFEQFDESLQNYSLGEDWEFSLRARNYGTFRYAADASVWHHFSPMNRDTDAAMTRLRWKNYHYFFRKLRAGRDPLNYAFRTWWEIGESYKWLRAGMGLPWSFGDLAKRTVSGIVRALRRI